MVAKVYGSPKSFRTQKVLIAAKLAKFDVTVTDEKPPEDKFPLGVTPAFEDGNVLLHGAESIAMHIAGRAFHPANCSELLQWLIWGESCLLPNVLAYVLPCVSVAHLDHKSVALAREELMAQLTKFNSVLLSRTFLVGERLSLADVSIALDLLPAYQYVLDEPARKQLVNVTRWFQTILHQPVVHDVIGDVELAKQVARFDSKKFNELTAKLNKEKPGHKDEQRGHKEEQKGHKEEQKGHKDGKKDKKEKKKEKPKDEEDEGEDDVHAQEPKSVDPFASMPKGTFVMDNFKRVYSNEDTATKAIPWFWENFDPANYSIWYTEYKYPEELTLTFMSCNLIGGMFQRLEKLKKNAFASVCLFGTDNNSTISGIWIWRGHELVFPLCPDWMVDYESYKWTKLDPADEKTKKLVNEYLMWEGDFDGKKFNQGKIFK